jgi:hypothetical protein
MCQPASDWPLDRVEDVGMPLELRPFCLMSAPPRGSVDMATDIAH